MTVLTSDALTEEVSRAIDVSHERGAIILESMLDSIVRALSAGDKVHCAASAASARAKEKRLSGAVRKPALVRAQADPQDCI